MSTRATSRMINFAALRRTRGKKEKKENGKEEEEEEEEEVKEEKKSDSVESSNFLRWWLDFTAQLRTQDEQRNRLIDTRQANRSPLVLL
jgi:hypothetical protein